MSAYDEERDKEVMDDMYFRETNSRDRDVPGYLFHIRDLDGTIRAFADLKPMFQYGFMWVCTILVEPDQRRKGLGSRMIRRGADTAKKLGFRALITKVPEDAGAARFFERCGFVSGGGDSMMLDLSNT